jgi:hypothetical protein
MSANKHKKSTKEGKPTGSLAVYLALFLYSFFILVGCGGMPLFLFYSVDQDFVRWIRVLNVPKKEMWRALK